MSSKQENEEKSKDVESKFQQWLDKNDIPYWYIQQDISTFSPALKKYMTKRPDFMILIPHVGFVLVDAEYKSPAEKYEVFQIDTAETEQYCNLQNYFNLQVWYVFANEQNHYKTWHWIPVSKVLEIAKKERKIFDSPRGGGSYCSISMDKFIQVSHSSGNIGSLFAEIPKFY